MLSQDVSQHTLTLDSLEKVRELYLASHQHQVLLFGQVHLFHIELTELLLLLCSLKLGGEVFLTKIDVKRALVKVRKDVTPQFRLQLDVPS
jgi:hypothetical protein